MIKLFHSLGLVILKIIHAPLFFVVFLHVLFYRSWRVLRMTQNKVRALIFLRSLILILGLYFLLLFIDRKFYELILLVYGLGYLFLLSKLSFLFFIFSNWFKKLEGFIGVSLFFDDSDVNFISYFLLRSFDFVVVKAFKA